LSTFILGGLEAAALEAGINPSGNLRPQPDLDGEQCIDFESTQLPTLFTQLLNCSPRGAGELEPQLLVRQQAANDSFNRSM
jgi:hypothetical protein